MGALRRAPSFSFPQRGKGRRGRARRDAPLQGRDGFPPSREEIRAGIGETLGAGVKGGATGKVGAEVVMMTNKPTLGCLARSRIRDLEEPITR